MSIFIEGHESRSDKEGGLSMTIFRIIFGTGSPKGRLFDIVLLWAIMISVLLVMLESVPSLQERFQTELRYAEWFFTILFTIEYVLRIIIVRRPLKYMLSFYGIVDLVSILPSYLGLIFVGTHSLMVIRTLRLLRVFRVLKLMRYVRELRSLGDALIGSKRKIAVFLMSVLALTVIFGTIMYMIESEGSGFHQYTSQHILGNCYPDNSWLWGYRTTDRSWTILGINDHVTGLRYNRGSHWIGHCGTDKRQTQQHRCSVRALWGHRPF